MVQLRPAADRAARRLEPLERRLVHARLGVDDVAGRMDARAVDRLLRREALVEDPGGDRRPARCAAACRPRSPIASTSPSRVERRVGAIMLSIRAPGSSGPVSRSISPSMLFRCRSSPGRKSPEPRPRLVVRTQALPSASTTTRFVVCVSGPASRRARRRAREPLGRRQPVEPRQAPQRRRDAGEPAGVRTRARVRHLHRLAPRGSYAARSSRVSSPPRSLERRGATPRSSRGKRWRLRPRRAPRARRRAPAARAARRPGAASRRARRSRALDSA